jgi:putative transcriptional regulator
MGHNRDMASDGTAGQRCGGKLLVATPPLVDPNFDRSVVFVLEHGPSGALGVVVNRPTDEPCPDELDGWATCLSEPDAVFEGGPVERAALIGLALTPAPGDEGWHDIPPPDGGQWPGAPAGSRLGSVDLTRDPDEVAPGLSAARIFRGYSGWAPGQLDHELEEGSWMVFDATADDVFSADPDGLWRRVVARQGGRVAWIAAAPDDLTAN